MSFWWRFTLIIICIIWPHHSPYNWKLTKSRTVLIVNLFNPLEWCDAVLSCQMLYVLALQVFYCLDYQIDWFNSFKCCQEPVLEKKYDITRNLVKLVNRSTLSSVARVLSTSNVICVCKYWLLWLSSQLITNLTIHLILLI